MNRLPGPVPEAVMGTPKFLPASPVTDSNRAPFPYEGNALPNELTGRGACRHRVYRNRGPRFGRLGHSHQKQGHSAMPSLHAVPATASCRIRANEATGTDAP